MVQNARDVGSIPSLGTTFDTISSSNSTKAYKIDVTDGPSQIKTYNANIQKTSALTFSNSVYSHGTIVDILNGPLTPVAFLVIGLNLRVLLSLKLSCSRPDILNGLATAMIMMMFAKNKIKIAISFTTNNN